MPVLGFLELNLGVIAACLPTFIALSKSKFVQDCRRGMATQAKSIRLGLRFSDIRANHRPPKVLDVGNDLETDEERPGCRESCQSIIYSQDTDTYGSTMYSRSAEEEHTFTRPADRTEQQRSWIMR